LVNSLNATRPHASGTPDSHSPSGSSIPSRASTAFSRTGRSALEHGHVVQLTDPECTRYWMRLDEAVDLVMDTADTMVGGELSIPELPAYQLVDLAEAMGVSYMVTGLGLGEKRHESMRPGETSEHARRMSVDELREGLRHV
jgi:hypothetical protein